MKLFRRVLGRLPAERAVRTLTVVREYPGREGLDELREQQIAAVLRAATHVTRPSV